MAFSPELWRQLRINLEQAVKDSGDPGVRLRGGPCDGWLVYDHAPMLLQEDWYENVPEDEEAGVEPGHYSLVDEMDEDARIAQWAERSTP
jgi:hypothetical protein